MTVDAIAVVDEIDVAHWCYARAAYTGTTSCGRHFKFEDMTPRALAPLDPRMRARPGAKVTCMECIAAECRP